MLGRSTFLGDSLQLFFCRFSNQNLKPFRKHFRTFPTATMSKTWKLFEGCVFSSILDPNEIQSLGFENCVNKKGGSKTNWKQNIINSRYNISLARKGILNEKQWVRWAQTEITSQTSTKSHAPWILLLSLTPKPLKTKCFSYIFWYFQVESYLSHAGGSETNLIISNMWLKLV